MRNRKCPEASIVEGVVGRDCLNRSSRYLHDGVKTRFSRYQTEDEECDQNLSPIFPKIELRHEAHRYALFNTGDEQVENLIQEHKNIMSNHSRLNAWARARNHSREFSNWFEKKHEVDEYGLTRVYFNKLCSKDDPFVLASQVYQVFYVTDPIEKDVYYARNKVPIDLYDLEEENCPNISDTFWREPNDDFGSTTRLDEGDFRWSREDVAVDIVDILCNAQHSKDTIVEISEEEEDVDETDWDWMEEDD
ncbi:hypothetical protein KY290_014040 [Solanum tuberosum]|uniref:DUF4216 domain-containing protein n=1 Tax=Solanum tuberosum TaxID=4113 RepID=A0ABQ7VNJ8_SOLTU|nr:hypothetical protein KY289_014137 [Solanum tuberosum]KAH0770059.1 hypothetical protein KY290_014040 [Solanum tuberosum]